jgi:hypothetical protein
VISPSELEGSDTFAAPMSVDPRLFGIAGTTIRISYVSLHQITRDDSSLPSSIHGVAISAWTLQSLPTFWSR